MENKKYFEICEHIAINVGFSTLELEVLSELCDRLELAADYTIGQIFEFWEDCDKAPKDCNSTNLMEGFYILYVNQKLGTAKYTQRL